MRRLHAFLLFLALWAAIFLPGLGSTELKGEEGRRILPAVTMLQTGNWIVPYVGGKPYARKPPLVNWLIAGSFQLTGVQNEWAARLPTVLALLALGATLIGLAHASWMKPETALVAAILALTPAAVLDKGRLAEIDGLYFALTGLATVIWLAWWVRGREEISPWRLWCVPAIFLGLGMLAKGPTHLLFFYALVAGVLWRARAWKDLRHPAPWCGLLLIAGISALWAWPYFHQAAAAETLQVWQKQSAGRLTSRFDWANYLTTIPRALKDLLPWVLFAPLLWRRELPALGARLPAAFVGARWAILLTFFGLLLLPGMLPRYTMPLIAPFSCLLALVLADDRLPPPSRALRSWWHANAFVAGVLVVAALAGPIVLAVALHQGRISAPLGLTAGMPSFLIWSILGSAMALVIALAALLRRNKLARPALIATTSAALLGAGMCLFAGTLVPFINSDDRVRALARAIDTALPSGEKLGLYDPEYLPAIFYLRTPYQYEMELKDIPPEIHWLLVRRESFRKSSKDWVGFTESQAFPEPKGVPLVLLKRS